MDNKIEKLKSVELLLLLLYLDNKKPIVGHTKLQKMVFLFEKEIYKKYGFSNLMQNLFGFEAYHYGPYSKRVVKDLDFLNNYGFIDIKNYSLDDSTDYLENDEYRKNYFEYNITSTGIKYVEDRVLTKLDQFQVEALEGLKKGVNSMEIDKLLSYVYRNYPEMTKNSLIKGKYV
ncbi:hypothetical protein [Nitratifractor sp.]